MPSPVRRLPALACAAAVLLQLAACAQTSPAGPSASPPASPPASTAAAASNGHVAEYPTVDRVLYVQECMRDHPGGFYEMVNKCACAFERTAAELSFDDYVTMSTAANANSIGGERGGYIRDTEALQKQIRSYRALQGKVKKACFVTR